MNEEVVEMRQEIKDINSRWVFYVWLFFLGGQRSLKLAIKMIVCHLYYVSICILDSNWFARLVKTSQWWSWSSNFHLCMDQFASFIHVSRDCPMFLDYLTCKCMILVRNKWESVCGSSHINFHSWKTAVMYVP